MEKIIKTWKARPFSWSQLASWEWNHDVWYSKYILNKKEEDNKEMALGRLFAESCEKGKPLAPVTLYSTVEYKLKAMFNNIPLVGYCDTYEPHTKLGEFKTSKKPWTADRVDSHGQLSFYALLLYIQHKVKPEDLHIQLQNILTKENGDFSLDFVKPIKVYTFETKRTMKDILQMGARINSTRKEMEKFVRAKSQETI